MSPMLKDSAVALAIELIRLDGGTQPRVDINEDTVSDYAAIWQSANGSYPFDSPCEVFHDGTSYWCADGFHRILGAARAKRASVPCVVHKGSVRDAIVYAAKCNASHGLRRTAADKRHIVTKFLKDEEWSKKSNRWIAEVCDVSHMLVGTIRTELEESDKLPSVSTGSSSSSHIRKTGKDGKKRSGKSGAGKKRRKVTDNKESVPASEKRLAGSCEQAKEPPFAHSWVSDGSGDRYCELCKEDHPGNVQDKDEGGKEIPKSLLDVFRGRSTLKGIINRIGAILGEIDEITKTEAGQRLPLTEIKTDGKNLQAAIKSGLPHAVCPYCRGKKCDKCDKFGWLHKARYDGIPEDRR